MLRLFATFATLLGGYVILNWVDALKHTVTLAGVTLSLAFILAVIASYMTFAKMGTGR
jgi:hypothetical protein